MGFLSNRGSGDCPPIRSFHRVRHAGVIHRGEKMTSVLDPRVRVHYAGQQVAASLLRCSGPLELAAGRGLPRHRRRVVLPARSRAGVGARQAHRPGEGRVPAVPGDGRLPRLRAAGRRAVRGLGRSVRGGTRAAGRRAARWPSSTHARSRRPGAARRRSPECGSGRHGPAESSSRCGVVHDGFRRISVL